MDTVLQQAPVSGLVVVCVETVLEHGCLDIISLVLLLRGKNLDLLPEQIRLDVLVFEIPPAGLVAPGYAPSLTGALLGNSLDSFIDVSRCYFPDGESNLVMRYQFPSASTLHLASLKLHVVMISGKLTVLGTPVGTVGIQVFYSGSGYPFAVSDSLPKEMAVGKDCSFYLYGGDDVGRTLAMSLSIWRGHP